MRILVTGARGMLGRDLLPRLQVEHEAIGIDVDDLDITNAAETLRVFVEIQPELVVHAAAYTDVDRGESDGDAAFAVNAEGTAHVARACARLLCPLFYLSTDFVFDGGKRTPYRTEDPVRPLSRYGATKLAGELAVASLAPDHAIIRTSWLFGLQGRNFIASILAAARRQPSLAVVDDQRGRPTFTVDLAEALSRLIAVQARGIIHAANSGETTWFEFAREILRSSGLSGIPVTPLTSEQLNRPARRPAYSVMDLSRYEQLTGHIMRPWQEAMQAYLQSSGQFHLDPSNHGGNL